MGDSRVGKIIQVIGPVVDVEFEPGNLPEIQNALFVSNPAINDTPDNLVIEVALHLGDNVCRCVAMDQTDGLVRGMQVRDAGSPIAGCVFTVIHHICSVPGSSPGHNTLQATEQVWHPMHLFRSKAHASCRFDRHALTRGAAGFPRG